MPPREKTLSCYPEPNVRAICAWNAPSANAAIGAFARIAREKTPDLDRASWCYLADVLNGTIYDEQWAGEFLVAEVADAHELNRTGDKWFAGEGDELEASVSRARGERPMTAADARVAELIESIRGWDYATLQSVLLAVRWFWDHHEHVDAQEDAWWEPAFRARFAAARRGETQGAKR